MQKFLLIEDIENANNKTVHVNFNEKIDELDCVSPISADLTAKSLGEFIQIKGHIKGLVNLECDLCLEKFEYKIDFDIDELYAKGSIVDDYDNSDKEFEIKEGQFVTDLNGDNKIDIYDLLYQSVILNFPNKKVCGINCKGKDYLSEEDTLDPRLEVFNNLQINPKK
jgi:uncharacterized protein